VTTTTIAPATPPDLELIAACVRRFRLDDEDLRPEQFVVVREGARVVAFGRIKPYGRVHELGSVGVVEEERGHGLGALVVRELIRRFPTPEVYITTDLPGYFARFGFSRLADPPPEIAAKIERVCARLRSGVVAMVLYKNDATRRS
jgi:N-acetylglutamate synthase-like GNAT family acetyltransferase